MVTTCSMKCRCQLPDMCSCVHDNQLGVLFLLQPDTNDEAKFLFILIQRKKQRPICTCTIWCDPYTSTSGSPPAASLGSLLLIAVRSSAMVSISYMRRSLGTWNMEPRSFASQASSEPKDASWTNKPRFGDSLLWDSRAATWLKSGRDC
jgi:hypothetical protein